MSKIKWIYITITFIALTNSVLSQNFVIKPYFTISTFDIYSPYRFSFDMSYQILNRRIDFGLTLGGISMYYDNSEFSYVDSVGYKFSWGIHTNYYLSKDKIDNLKPYIGIRYNSNSGGHFVSPRKGKIILPGYYNFDTKQDFSISILLGTILYTDVINFLFDIEFEHREFNLEYIEYYWGSTTAYFKTKTFSSAKNINSLKFSFGVYTEL